jgi:hypothetical protein
MRWEDHVACIREERKVYKVSVEKPDGKRSLRRPMYRWDDGIRMGGVDSVGSGQRLVVGFCEHWDEPLGSGATEVVSSYIHITNCS